MRDIWLGQAINLTLMIGSLLTIVADTGGEGTLTQWVHCEFVVSFEAIHPVVPQQVCGEFF